jgi:hypothetical protein
MQKMPYRPLGALRSADIDLTISPALSKIIDVLRALSAFLVVIYHIRIMIYGAGHHLPFLIR